MDFPAVYLLNLNPSSVRLVSSVGFFLAILWTLAAQFGPKVYRIYIGEGDQLSDVVSNNMLNKRHAITPTIKDGQPEEVSSDANNASNPEVIEQPQKPQEKVPEYIKSCFS